MYNTNQNTYLNTSASAKKKPGFVTDPVLDGSMNINPIIHNPKSQFIPWNQQPRSSMVSDNSGFTPQKSQPIKAETVSSHSSKSSSSSDSSKSANFGKSKRGKYDDLVEAMNKPLVYQTGFDSCKP